MNFNILEKIDFKKRILISLSGFLFLLLVLIYFFIAPALSNIKEVKNKINKQRINLEKKYLQEKNSKEISQKIREAEDKMKSVNKIFINQNRSLEFITALEDVATKNNVIQKINLLDVSVANNFFYEELSLQLFTQGDFQNQMNYLIDLESLDYYININSLDIKSINQSLFNFRENTHDLNLFIQADTYWSL